jgi:hypothetical protein
MLRNQESLRMKTVAPLLFAMGCVALAQAQTPTDPVGPTRVVVDRATSDIFPESWRTAKVNAKAEPLEPEEQTRCREIVDKVLAKYPRAVLTGNLKTVFVLGRLEYSGITAAGSNSANEVYIVGRKYSAGQIEDLFHAEFSSILLRKFPNHLDSTREFRVETNPPAGVRLSRQRGAGGEGEKSLAAIERGVAGRGLHARLREGEPGGRFQLLGLATADGRPRTLESDGETSADQGQSRADDGVLSETGCGFHAGILRESAKAVTFRAESEGEADRLSELQNLVISIAARLDAGGSTAAGRTLPDAAEDSCTPDKWLGGIGTAIRMAVAHGGYPADLAADLERTARRSRCHWKVTNAHVIIRPENSLSFQDVCDSAKAE